MPHNCYILFVERTGDENSNHEFYMGDMLLDVNDTGKSGTFCDASMLMGTVAALLLAASAMCSSNHSLVTLVSLVVTAVLLTRAVRHRFQQLDVHIYTCNSCQNLQSTHIKYKCGYVIVCFMAPLDLVIVSHCILRCILICILHCILHCIIYCILHCIIWDIIVR